MLPKLRDTRSIRWLFIAVLVALVSVLGFLVWRIGVQDAALGEQQAVDRQEAAADRLVALLHQQLGAVDDALEVTAQTGHPPSTLLPGAAVVLLTPQVPRAWPPGRILFFPDVSDLTIDAGAAFDRAEELEYREHNANAATAEYERLAASSDVAVRAVALAGLARNQMNNGRTTDALATYERLQSLGDTLVAGVPAGVAGPLGALAIVKRQHDTEQTTRWARVVRDALDSARYPISRGAFFAIRQEIATVLAASSSSPDVAPADAIAEFSRSHAAAPAGRMVVGGTEPYLVVWKRIGTATAAMTIGASAMARAWLPDNIDVQLTTEDGRTAVRSGNVQPSDRPSIRLSSVTRLPWTIQVTVSSRSAESAAALARRRLLLAGLGVVILVVIIGGVIVGRAVTRELTLARMQSDFVAGVSHEFRSPLTAIIQTSELLVRGRVATKEDRNNYYQALYAEGRRLQRLVENVLMFGGLETGRFRFRADAVDLRALVTETVQQCTRPNREDARRVHLQFAATDASFTGDRDALQMMLANLIDNALKYSPAGQDVTVTTQRTRDGQVEFAIADHGIGIAAAERERIFERFARGSEAIERQIRGTGVGLALAREIARAHGGDIAVESELGVGSRFVVTLS